MKEEIIQDFIAQRPEPATFLVILQTARFTPRIWEYLWTNTNARCILWLAEEGYLRLLREEEAQTKIGKELAAEYAARPLTAEDFGGFSWCGLAPAYMLTDKGANYLLGAGHSMGRAALPAAAPPGELRELARGA